MAFTVKIKSNKRCFLAGDQFTITATIEGDNIPQNIAYAWFKNNQPLPDDTNILSINNATSENAGNYKVTVTDTDTQEAITSDILKMDEAAIVVKIDQPSHYVAYDENTTLSATVSFSTGKSPSDGYVIHYSWEKDGVPVGEESADLYIQNFTDEKNGEYTVKAWGESEASTDSASIDVMAVSLSVIENVPLEKTVVLGKPIILPYRVTEVVVGDVPESMPKLLIKPTWYLQRKGQQSPTVIGTDAGEGLEGFTIMPNGYLHKEAATNDDTAKFWCVAKLVQEIKGQVDDVEEIGSNHCSLEVVESLHKMFRYVHPIPWRKTSFIYIGWWVFDEIVKFNEAGLEWRNREVYEDSKYASDIETIAAAEEKYGDCICMESRNGFMYNSKEFHKLDRDILERVLRIRETPPA